MVSVIVTLYECETQISKCIKSILDQTYNDYEIVLVEDGSSDGTGAFCDELSARYPFINVIHQKNGGCGSAKNTGLKYASKDLITFVDSDDHADIKMLESLVKLIYKYNADISGCAYYREFDNGELVYYGNNNDTPIQMTAEEALKNMVSGYDIISHWGKVFRSATIKDISIKSINSQDYESMPRILKKAKKYVYIGLPYYYWSFNTKSVTNSPLKKGWVKKYFQAYTMNIDFFAENYPNLFMDAKKAYFSYAISFLYKSRGTYDEDRKCLIKDLKKYIDLKSFFLLNNMERIKIVLSFINLHLLDLFYDIKQTYRKQPTKF